MGWFDSKFDKRRISKIESDLDNLFKEVEEVREMMFKMGYRIDKELYTSTCTDINNCISENHIKIEQTNKKYQ